jgi:TRAP-type C4-dicarboxylate transport system substrate-binding protein
MYMYGFKNGKDSMKEEIERLRAVLREFFISGDFDIVTTGNEEATQAWIERAHAELREENAELRETAIAALKEGEKSDD